MSNIKDILIDKTIELIRESDGNTESITARAIAKKSGVALGLINYHFGSKENLISECCNKIINDLLISMKPDLLKAQNDGLSDRERLISYASQTFDYLFANRHIVKISILSDLKNYRQNCNSHLTQIGFQMALSAGISAEKRRMISFLLASAMQTAFLAGNESKEIIGYDLMNKRRRKTFIEDVVNIILGAQ